MKALTFKLLLLIALLVLSGASTFAQYDWQKYASNPLSIHGSPGSWDESALVPYVIFNADLNRYEMWYTSFTGAFPNGGIGFAYSSDGITWTKNPTPVMTPSATGWDSLFVGAGCVVKESGGYKMWYTGWKSTTRVPRSIGYATSPDGINWTKHPQPVLSPGTQGWEVPTVAYCDVIRVADGYWMFYAGGGATTTLTGRAFSTDGITWQRDIANNPVLPAGGTGSWDRNNYLPRLLNINNTLYLWYTAESNPGVSGTAIGLATSVDTGKTWTKYSGNPVLTRGTTGSWDNGWIETGSVLFTQNELKLYYDGGGAATGNQGRVGLAISTLIPTNWQMQTSNLPNDVFVINFSAVNNQVCWAVGQKIPGNTTPYASYIRTTDGGTNWILNTIPGISNGYLDEIFAIDANTAYVTCYKLLGTSGTVGIYKTTDGGTTWNRQDAYNSSQTGPAYIYFFDSQNGIVIGDYLETYTTTNGGTNWNPVTMPAPLGDEWTWLGESRFTVSGNNIWFCTNRGRVFKSTDKGFTWSIVLSESQYYDWRPSMAFQNSQTGIYSLNMGGNATDHIVRKTTDGGTTWSTISNPVLTNLAPSTIQYIPGTNSTYILTAGRAATMKGTAVTYDAGETWTLLDTVGCFLVNFASYSTGWGSQWGTNVVYKYIGSPLPVELTSFTAEALNQKVILRWTTATELNNNGFEIQRKVAESDFATIGFVKGEGTTTNQKEYYYIDKDLTDGKYFYRLKQIDYNGTYEYSNAIEVDVRSLNEYALEQNYPNPFNPTTTVGYVLKEKTNAKLILLNAIGEEVAVLVNEEQDKGFHKVDFNAANLPSGVYFYRLQAGDYMSVKKMILLK